MRRRMGPDDVAHLAADALHQGFGGGRRGACRSREVKQQQDGQDASHGFPVRRRNYVSFGRSALSLGYFRAMRVDTRLVSAVLVAAAATAEACPECGATLQDFRASGRVGCPTCWTAFERPLRDEDLAAFPDVDMEIRRKGGAIALLHRDGTPY